MRKFFKDESGNALTELMMLIVVLSMFAVLIAVSMVVDASGEKGKANKLSYDGLKIAVTEEGVSGDKPRSVVTGTRAEALAKLLTVSKSKKVSDKKIGTLDRTIDVTFKGKTATFKVYAKKDTLYIVGDGTGVLKGVKGEKIVKVSGWKRDDVDNWLKDRSVLEGIFADGF